MAKQTYTIRGADAYIDQVFVMALDKDHRNIEDQIFRTNVAMAFFFEKKRSDLAGASNPFAGGRQFFVPMEAEENPTAGAVEADTGISTDDYDPIYGATFWPKSYAANITWTKAQQAIIRGDPMVHNIVKFKMDNTTKTLKKRINVGIWTGAGSTSVEMDGLPRIIPATVPASQSTTVGNLSPSTYAWWRSQAINMSGYPARTHMEGYMIQMHNTIVAEDGKVDGILSDQTSCELYEQTAMTYLSIVKPKFADVSFSETPAFKGAPIMFDKDAPSGELRFVDRDECALATDPMFWFHWTGNKEIHNVPVTKFKQVLCDCNMIRKSARRLGCIFNVSSTG